MTVFCRGGEEITHTRTLNGTAIMGSFSGGEWTFCVEIE
jgi:hypothetical protein